jgi:hypothetical protein
MYTTTNFLSITSILRLFIMVMILIRMIKLYFFAFLVVILIFLVVSYDYYVTWGYTTWAILVRFY